MIKWILLRNNPLETFGRGCNSGAFLLRCECDGRYSQRHGHQPDGAWQFDGGHMTLSSKGHLGDEKTVRLHSGEFAQSG